MDGKLCPGIHPPPPPEIFTPSFREIPPFNAEIFQSPPFLKFWLEYFKTPFKP